MALDFTSVDAEIANLNTVTASVVAAFQGYGQMILDHAADQAKVIEIGTKMKVDADALAAAVLANTPPPPPVA